MGIQNKGKYRLRMYIHVMMRDDFDAAENVMNN